MLLHGLQSSQRPAALNNDPAVLRLAKGQNGECCTALLTHLQRGAGSRDCEWTAPPRVSTADYPSPGILRSPQWVLLACGHSSGGLGAQGW